MLTSLHFILIYQSIPSHSLYGLHLYFRIETNFLNSNNKQSKLLEYQFIFLIMFLFL